MHRRGSGSLNPSNQPPPAPKEGWTTTTFIAYLRVNYTEILTCLQAKLLAVKRLINFKIKEQRDHMYALSHRWQYSSYHNHNHNTQIQVCTCNIFGLAWMDCFCVSAIVFHTESAKAKHHFPLTPFFSVTIFYLSTSSLRSICSYYPSLPAGS